ncbi:MAG: hypothetical protein IH587_12920 [Anaerolineae bacterium]|nr:hypothetical protein [Anaerolineae bacterium]
MQIRARNISWLAIVAAMIGLAAFAPGTESTMTAALLGVFGLAAAASLIQFQPGRLVEQSRSSLTALRMSSEAREAVERVRRRGNNLHGSVMLLDVGLITTLSGPEGLVMRRARDLSKDDDGVRPFTVLHVSPEDADRRSIIRFEFIDGDGEVCYVHEMNTYLRDGEMNLLADQQMPLFDNDRVRAGEWDMRVYVDNRLVGAHPFSIAPSLEDRFPRAAQERAARRLREEEQEQETPLRLEDLLREQTRQRRER